jgi:tetratricopeptide (TPR) repeat protein
VVALRLLADAHVQRDEMALAQEALGKAIEAVPADPAAYLQLAELRADIGDASGALVTLERLLAQAPDNAAAQRAIARIQLEQPDASGLAETAARILETSPDNPLGAYLKGVALERGGQMAAAVEQFERALAQAPTAVEPVVALARNYLAQGQPEKAEGRLRALLEEDPDNLLALGLLGDVYLADGRAAEAEERFAQAIEKQPTWPLPYERLAVVRAAAGDSAGAIEMMRKGVETTGNPVLLFRLAGLMAEAGDDEGAAGLYEQMLVRDDLADAAANNLAMLLVTHRGDDPASLRRAAELAARLEESKVPNYLDTAGWVRLKTGDAERARVLLEQAATIGEPSPELRYHLGMAYLETGRADDARAQLSLATAANQDFPGIDEARDTLEGLTSSGP